MCLKGRLDNCSAHRLLVSNLFSGPCLIHPKIQSPEPILNSYPDQQLPDVVPKPTSALPENLAGTHILRSTPDLLNQKLWGWDLALCVSASTPGNSDAHWHLGTIDLEQISSSGEQICSCILVFSDIVISTLPSALSF